MDPFAVRSLVREFALGLPGAYEEFPSGESVAKVNKKVFVFLGHNDAETAGYSVKLKTPQPTPTPWPYRAQARTGTGWARQAGCRSRSGRGAVTRTALRMGRGELPCGSTEAASRRTQVPADNNEQESAAMTVLMTGFPGFLGSALLPGILKRTDDAAMCLVQSKFAALAKQRVTELSTAEPALQGRIQVVEGDITEPGLGLGADTFNEVTEAWHLAAVYDLAVAREVGVRVNVEGTRNVLDALERCPGLTRLHYFSTCYVSGRYAGPFSEDDLEVGAPFNNYYEETKHLAEAEVRRRMSAGMPATIYRPSIVVGDSRTGETQKFDGPYFLVQWLLRQPRRAIMPVAGDPTMTRVNVVPRDFIVNAIEYLSGRSVSEGRTYQLADPRPLTVDEMVDALARATGRELIKVPLPRKLAKASLARVPGLYRLMRIPPEVVDYFGHPTFYLTDHCRADLAGSGIEPPAFPSYVDRLVEYMRSHPEVSSAAMF